MCFQTRERLFADSVHLLFRLKKESKPTDTVSQMDCSNVSLYSPTGFFFLGFSKAEAFQLTHSICLRVNPVCVFSSFFLAFLSHLSVNVQNVRLLNKITCEELLPPGDLMQN